MQTSLSFYYLFHFASWHNQEPFSTYDPVWKEILIQWWKLNHCLLTSFKRIAQLMYCKFTLEFTLPNEYLITPIQSTLYYTYPYQSKTVLQTHCEGVAWHWTMEFCGTFITISSKMCLHFLILNKGFWLRNFLDFHFDLYEYNVLIKILNFTTPNPVRLREVPFVCTYLNSCFYF